MLNEKKQNEVGYVLEVLTHLYPAGQPTPTPDEAPDWIVTVEGRRVGIEVTELPDDELRPIEGNEAKVLEKASEFATETGLQGISVYVGFTRSRMIPNAEITLVARKLVETVIQALLDKIDGFMEIPIGNSLCEDIDEFGVFRDGNREKSVWKALRANSPKDLLASQIQLRVNDKHRKLPKYRSTCAECWLIVGADGYKGSTYYREAQAFSRAGYKTEFDRLFFVNIVKREVIELHRAPSQRVVPDA